MITDAQHFVMVPSWEPLYMRVFWLSSLCSEQTLGVQTYQILGIECQKKEIASSTPIGPRHGNPSNRYSVFCDGCTHRYSVYNIIMGRQRYLLRDKGSEFIHYSMSHFVVSAPSHPLPCCSVKLARQTLWSKHNA